MEVQFRFSFDVPENAVTGEALVLTKKSKISDGQRQFDLI